MPNDKPTDPTSELVPADAQRSARFGGIIPGQLHGGRGSISIPIDPDAEIIAKVKPMSGAEMLKFLRVPGNKEKYERALANRSK
jgi:hypothetical protein